jgi:ribonuclease T1
MAATRRTYLLIGAACALLLLIAGAFALGRTTSKTTTASTASTIATGQSKAGSSAKPSTTTGSGTTTHGTGTTKSTAPHSGLPTVKASALPPEARTTLGLIATKGPYPYSRDGVVYNNLEKILPKQGKGYYHEYTVVTPGSSDRGARRIITGKLGERFYTDDHYASFSEVVS